MNDFALIWDASALRADMAISANDLVADDGLRTAVMLSLYTDAPAQPGDVLPDGDTSRRGWWGNSFPSVPGDVFGSRLWLLDRSKSTPDVLARAEQYASEALQWLVDDEIAESIAVTATALPTGPGFVLDVVIRRPLTAPARFHFATALWAAEEARI